MVKIGGDIRSFSFKKIVLLVLAVLVIAGVFGVVSTHAAGDFVPDAKVTAVGKAAARAREVLNWAVSIKDAELGGQAPAILDLWTKTRTFTTIIIFIIFIVLAFGLILKTNWADDQKRRLPVLILAIIAAYLSFSGFLLLIKGIDYLQDRIFTVSITDSSGNKTTRQIKAEDFLTVSFNYQDFQGFRRQNTSYDEAVKNTLFLVNLTTWTNYAIAAVFVVRIVFLWLLLIFSPLIFPFLAFSLTRNIAVFWIREFARWLFLGPLIALFLAAVPYIWKHTQIIPNDVPNALSTSRVSGIPLQTNKDASSSSNVYQSGTNIYLAPPGVSDARLQLDSSLGSGNNLSETDTYARYLVGIVMVWVALILPFFLMRSAVSIISTAGSNIWNMQLKDYFKTAFGRFGGSTPTSKGGAQTLINTGPVVLKSNKVFLQNLSPTFDREMSKNTKSSEAESKFIITPDSAIGALGLKSNPYVASMIKHQESTGKKASIASLANAEIDMEKDPQMANMLRMTVNNLKAGSSVNDKDKMGRIIDIKDLLLLKKVSGSKASESILNAISDKGFTVKNQNLPRQIIIDNLSGISNVSISKFINESGQGTNLPDNKALKIETDKLDEILSKPVKAIMSSPEDLKFVLDFSNKMDVAQAVNKERPAGLKQGDGEYKKFDSPEEANGFVEMSKIVDKKAASGDISANLLRETTGSIASVIKGNFNSGESNEIENGTISGITANKETQEQFEAAKKNWSDFYKKESTKKPVQERLNWLENEILKIKKTLSDLMDDTKKAKALKKLEKDSPYLLLGGYEFLDIVVYLKAQLEAAKDTLKKIMQ